MKEQRGAVTAVLNMSLFVLLLLSGLLCSASGFPRKYFYINQSMTWSEAQSYCRLRFSDLATVDSMDDVNRMINTVNDGYSGSVWIGLKRATQRRWVWSNGDDTLAHYSAWGLGFPTGFSYCGYFANGLWFDTVCSESLFFACYDESVGNILIKTWKTWKDAQTYCREHYTDLAIIRSLEEQKRLHALVGDGPWVWIGLNWNRWYWSDQWGRFYRYWSEEYPAAIGECAAMSTTVSWKWINYSCGQPSRFICHEVYKKQIIRLNLSCNGACNLDDSSLQTATMNQIRKKLQGVGLENYISLNCRKNTS